jgi:hypothetical protein
MKTRKIIMRAANEIAAEYDFDAEVMAQVSWTTVANRISQKVYDEHGINCAGSRRAHDYLIEAIDGLGRTT